MDNTFPDRQELVRYGAPRRDAMFPWLPPLVVHGFFGSLVMLFKMADRAAPGAGHAGVVGFTLTWLIFCLFWVWHASSQRKDVAKAIARAREERLDELRKASIHFGVESALSGSREK